MTKTMLVVLAGGNQGDTKDYLERALTLVQESVGELLKTSSLYQSDPWGFNAPQHFLNQVWVLETGLNPHESLAELLKIEKKLGRERNAEAGYSSRTIDLDMLYFGHQLINDELLTVPHPRIQERKFALIPLAEVLPDYEHPILKLTNKKLLENCRDGGIVIRINQ